MGLYLSVTGLCRYYTQLGRLLVSIFVHQNVNVTLSGGRRKRTKRTILSSAEQVCLPAADPGEYVGAMLRWSAEKLQDALRVVQLHPFHQRTRNSLQNKHFTNLTMITNIISNGLFRTMIIPNKS